ncbi:MAG: winged helix-turn-helix domain-containing protein [Vicinamibacterales bacterium]
MPNEPPAYRFGEYTLEPGEHRLLRASDEVTLRPKAFETLLFLVSRHGHTVTKNELLDAVWPGTFVSDAVLTHCVAEVRKALQDDAQDPRLLKTIPKIGYAFVAEVRQSSEPADAGPFLRAVPERHPASAIAVLPFANLSADPDNEYFCDGLSEELTNGLTKVAGLRVVAHSSSFSFKGRDTDVREIGRQLGVGSVLEGSVRKAGDRLRISAQLIDTAGGFHVWCEQYDRTLEDIFALQDEISQSVLAALRVELVKAERAPVITPSTASMEAYLLYLQGRSFWHRRFSGQLQKAMASFEQAIQKDPGFALAYSGLADSFSALGVWAFMPPHDAFPRAMALARQALVLDAGLADAHASMALIHMFYDWDWTAAERALVRALALNPGSALVHLWAAHYLSIVGRFEEALAEALHAQALDPLSSGLNANVGWTFYLAGQYGRAIEELQKVLTRFPGNPMALLYLGFATAAVGRPLEAASFFEASAATPGGMPWAAESVGWAAAVTGDLDRARRVLEASVARSLTSYVPSSGIACIQLGLGDDDGLFEWLGRSVEERDALIPWIKFMPIFDRVRPDPRFQALLAQIGLP